MNEYRRWVGRLAGGFCLFDGRQTTDQTQTPEETLGAPYDAGATRQCSCRQRIDRRSTVHRPSWRGWRLEKRRRGPRGLCHTGGSSPDQKRMAAVSRCSRWGGPASCEVSCPPGYRHSTTAPRLRQGRPATQKTTRPANRPTALVRQRQQSPRLGHGDGG